MHFQINAGFDCVEEGAGCDAFAADTGLDPANAPFVARFSVESTQPLTTPAPGGWGQEYDDQPGLNYRVQSPMSIVVGDLAVEFSQFHMRLASYRLDGPGSIFTLWGTQGDHVFWFSMVDRATSHFIDYSLAELAAAPLTGFRSEALNAASVAVYLGHEGRFSAPQREEIPLRITRVPEPQALVLFFVAAMSLFLARRYRPAARRGRHNRSS